MRKCSLCSESFTSQKELNDHVAAVHNYKFLCSDRKCGKAFRSSESLRKHKICHRNMKFLCNICGEKYPLPQTYQVTKPCIRKTKNVIVHTQNVIKSTKQKQSLIAIRTTDTNKNHPRPPLTNVSYVKKCFKNPNI